MLVLSDMCIDERIELFLDELEDNFPELEGNLGYYYDDKDDVWNIYYTHSYMMTYLSFQKKSGELIRKYLYDFNDYNITFYYLDKEIEFLEQNLNDIDRIIDLGDKITELIGLIKFYKNNMYKDNKELFVKNKYVNIHLDEIVDLAWNIIGMSEDKDVSVQ